MNAIPSRRTVLGGSAASLATAGTATALAAATRDPDAALLVAIAAFDALERRVRDMHRGIIGVAEEDAADARSAPLEAQQDELLGLICGMRARTSAGLRARARSFLAWEGDAISRLASEADDPEEYKDRRMLAALLRDLAGSTAA